jgi:Rrf2 family protein
MKATGGRRGLIREAAKGVHITLHSNYAMRLLMFCALRADRVTTIAEVAGRYRISEHHLVKIAQTLAQLGYVETIRGRKGGVRLAKEPTEINVGAVIRELEMRGPLVECHDPLTNTCPIAAACRLSRLFAKAQEAFFSVLDGFWLADLVSQPNQLRGLLHLPAESEEAATPA